MPSKQSKTFTQHFEELERLVEELETEEDLDLALKKFERGLELSKEIKKRLAVAENRIAVMKKDADALEDV